MLVTIFNWNGNLYEELAEDEKRFGIRVQPTGQGDMGHIQFEITGEPENIDRFLEHYELEEDEAEAEAEEALANKRAFVFEKSFERSAGPAIEVWERELLVAVFYDTDGGRAALAIFREALEKEEVK